MLYKTMEAAGLYMRDWHNWAYDRGDIIFIATNKLEKYSVSRKRLNKCCEKYIPLFQKGAIKTHDYDDVEIFTDDKAKLEYLNEKIIYDWRRVAMKGTIDKYKLGVKMY